MKSPTDGPADKSRLLKLRSKSPANSRNSPEPVPGSKNSLKEEVSRQARECVQALNRRFYHIAHEGQNMVLELQSSTFGTGLRPIYYRLSEFRQIWSHDNRVLVGLTRDGEEKKKLRGDVWLNSPDANFCPNGVAFNPRQKPASPTPDGAFNLWQGAGVRPASAPADDRQIRAFLDHLQLIICSGDQEHADYLLQYIAHWVQRPWEKPSVAVVMRAGQGAGKGTIMDPLITIAGAHGLATTCSRDVVGRFNYALETKTLVFFDEAFAGSKESSDMMKGLISENYTRVERKGVNPGFLPNYMRIFLATNHDSVVQVERDDRRYFFLRVSDMVKQDRAYFNSVSFMRAGHPDHLAFCSRLLGFLSAVDISQFDPHSRPVTRELVSQKLGCLEPVQRWVYEILRRGYLIQGADWPARIDSEQCHQYFHQWIQETGQKMPFGDVPKLIGRELARVGVTRRRERREGERVYLREFPPLEECREQLSQVYGGCDLFE